jgi:hypothetical protein
MNVTQTMTSWEQLQPLTRGIYSVLFAVACYLAFRYFISRINKLAPTGKEKGNYWEKIRARNEQ